ncbi:Putative NADH-flavin reductase [Frankineae bacterium MT45]|nr:Putative NADH-flavin reductase [Frankineae bacterium MT45]
MFGATGLTGREVVRIAHERGHRVIAAARSAADMSWPAGVEAAAVDILDPARVTNVLRAADAAVVAVGIGTTRGPTTVYSAGVEHVLGAMSELGVRRMSVVSAAPAGPRDALPRSQRMLARILDQFFGETYRDMQRMETALQGSDIDWTCLRPPRLVNNREPGYRLSSRPLGGSVGRTGLAAACLDVLDDTTFRREFRYISS